jgi:hypothetical protein
MSRCLRLFGDDCHLKEDGEVHAEEETPRRDHRRRHQATSLISSAPAAGDR